MYQELADNECRVEDGLFLSAPMPCWVREELDPQEESSLSPLNVLTGAEPSPDLVDRTMQQIYQRIAARQGKSNL
jgi:hypothetical protein